MKTTIQDIENFLRGKCPISTEYTRNIAEIIYFDVLQDIQETADTNFNDDDIRLAIGRVILDKIQS